MPDTNYWLEPVLDEIEKTYPQGKIVISSGISPSASYHIGHFRELLSADLIGWGLSQRGRQTEHLHIVDDFDPLRRRYDFLPAHFERYVGWPLCLVPDPEKCHRSYADHFFSVFHKYVKKLGVRVKVIRSYEDLYQSGRMAGYIEKSAQQAPLIRRLFKELANRDLGEDWMPLTLLSDENSFKDWTYLDIDLQAKTILYQDQNGQRGTVDYTKGRVKLNWRLDWPARWDLLGVMVEPHGHQEHGASGGSFETGKAFIKEIFGSAGPIPGFQYGHIHLIGDRIKMSSSKGNIITPDQAFKIMPPDMIRYLYARYPAKKRIDFDPGLGFCKLMDEFSSVDRAARSGQGHPFLPAYRYASATLQTPGMSSIGYSHLVTVYQTAAGDWSKIKQILIRNGYRKQVEQEEPAIRQELRYIDQWLQNWAPASVKFTLLEVAPHVSLKAGQKKFLTTLAERIEAADSGRDALWYHESIHNLCKDLGIEPAEAFEAVYQVLIGRTAGPRAGWFLATLPPEWLVKRLRDCSRAAEK